ncbi:c-type cytochrome [Nitrogeniibacter mangrovi]|uniref:C-type cytochrome n=1 Tax=Nitrogeniibacter mangrovi TaxID=2016596 RepID=A0A6C1B4X6_9RHOO|nr:cytochrome c [Nitrogeniibacter mangrovi]QID17915.1 c-type cytochrome [Nitrogeniibacter mangrovi]
MKHFILGVVTTVIVTLAAVAGIAYSGTVDVAADVPHHPWLFRMLTTTRERAIEKSARDILVPADLSDQERVRRGAGNYEAMCASCHLTPGEADSEIRKGLYPVPPNLTKAMTEAHEEEDAPGTPHEAQHFWVIKHGIKATGMAAWGKGGMSDDNIWDLVAFIQTLPQMGPAEYRAWVMASDGHQHGDGAMHGDDEHDHSDDHHH